VIWYDVHPSVCPSFSLSQPGPQQETRCCRFAAVGPAGRRYRSIAAAAAGECGQCHVVSRRTYIHVSLGDYGCAEFNGF